MSIRKTIDKSRLDLSTSKKTPLSRLSPYARSVYEYDDDKYTPDRHPVDRGEYGVTRPKERLANNLNYKIDSIIKHNSQLLDENNKLIQLIRDKDAQVEIMENRLQQQLEEEANNLGLIETEKNRILMDIQSDIDNKDRQIDTLIVQVQALTEELELKDAQFKMDLRKLGDEYSRESQHKMENVKRSQTYNMEIYETQIQRLKEILENKEEQMEETQHRYLLAEKRLEEEVRILSSELKHLSEKKILEEEQMKLNHETELAETIREGIQKREIEAANYENMIKRIKKELSDKTLSNERLNFRLEQTETENRAEYNFMQQEKVKTEYQLAEVEIRGKEVLEQEKDKLTKLASAEVSNLQVCHNNLVTALKSEKDKLMEVNDLKSMEINRLNSEMCAMREANSSMAAADNDLIKYLQEKLNSVEVNNQQELEILKVKMAHLHSGDVQGLVESHENQISSLAEQVRQLEDLVRDSREKLHTELVHKTQLRKHFEIELSKEHNINVELKLKLQAKHVEMKESLEDIRSKQQLTSGTFIREVTTTKKDMERREVDIKKLHQLINAKDIQLQQLNDMIASLKNDFEEHTSQKDGEIEELRTLNEELKREQKSEKEFYEKELRKKEYAFKTEKESLQEEVDKMRTDTYEELIRELKEIQEEKLRLEGEIARERLEKESILKSEMTHKELVDVIRLESSAALEMEKEGSCRKMTLEEGRLKKFYQEQLKSKDKQVEQLKRRLSEKDFDLRGTENKVADFEKKLQNMMDNQSKLRELETKTLNLGMDTNLVKNTSELFKNKFR